MDTDIIDNSVLPLNREIWISETQNETSFVISAKGIRKVTYRVIEKIVKWGQSGESLSGCKNKSTPLHCIREQGTRDLVGDCSNLCEEFFDAKGHRDQSISIKENRESVMVRLESGLSCNADIVPDKCSVVCGIGIDKIRTCVPRWQHGKLNRSIYVMDIG
jgi:hypothetical protein